MRNKRGINLMLANVMFLVINALAFSGAFAAVSRVGTTATAFEESYAKQIALLIDASKPGTKIEIDVSDLAIIANERAFYPTVQLNCAENEIFVKLTSTSGYTYKYFTQLEKCDYELDLGKRKFTINT